MVELAEDPVLLPRPVKNTSSKMSLVPSEPTNKPPSFGEEWAVHACLLLYLMRLFTLVCDVFFPLHLLSFVYVTNCLKAFASLPQFGQ